MLHDHVNVLRAQLQIAKKARDDAVALVSSMQELAAQYTTSQDFTTSSPRNSHDTKYGIALLRNNRGVLTIMNEKPNREVGALHLRVVVITNHVKGDFLTEECIHLLRCRVGDACREDFIAMFNRRVR